MYCVLGIVLGAEKDSVFVAGKCLTTHSGS